MTPSQLLSQFRSDMSDEEAPYLWSDEESFNYMNDAQVMFCRLSEGISDATTPIVCSITVPEGADWINLHPSILKIRGANRASDGAKVGIINYEDMQAEGIRFDGRTGPLTRLVVGMEENKARATSVVSLDDALSLVVFRLPLKTLTEDNAESYAFEIAERHHLSLLHWMKHKAYGKQDADTRDDKKATEFEQRFYDYCTGLVATEQRMKRHKVRTVAYGGI